MKAITSARLPSWKPIGLRLLGLAALLAGTLASFSASAQATVTSLTEAHYGKPGNKNGNTFTAAQFHFPAGIALDPSGTRLFVADCTNNAIRMVSSLGNRTTSQTYSPYTAANGISHPLAVAVDTYTNIYVLNAGNRTNGSLMVFNGFYYLNYNLSTVISTNASHLTNAVGMSLDTYNNAYITVRSNTVIRVTPGGVVTTVGIITAPKTSLRGIAYLVSGKLAIADAGNNGIWLMDPSNTNILSNAVQFTGFHGAADTNGPPFLAAFNGPENVIQAGNGVLVVADRLNNKVKMVDAYGNVTRIFGVKSSYWKKVPNLITPGWYDGTVNPNEAQDFVQARQPYGLALDASGNLYDTEVYYDILREATGTGLTPPPPPPPSAPTILTVTTNLDIVTLLGSVTLTWSAVPGATNYIVQRAGNSGGPYSPIANTTATTYTDTNVTPGMTYFYVVSASNAGGVGPHSGEVSATLPFAALAAPQIGYVDFPPPTNTSVFHNVVLNYGIAYNDLAIILSGATAGTIIYYTNVTVSSDGTVTNYHSGSVPGGYADGLPNQAALVSYLVSPQAAPFMTIKAHASKTGGYPDSPEVSASFQFQAAPPIISGTNIYDFYISEITTNAQLFYTLDGSDPRTSGLSLANIATYSVSNNVWIVNNVPTITSNTLFQVYALRANYQSSAVVSNLFLISSAVANNINFGFASGPGSSQYVASPGQHFLIPVGLSLLPDAPPIYGLQFGITVTNLGPNAVAPGAVDFQSLIGQPDVFDPGYFLPIPPYVFIGGSQPSNDLDAVQFPDGNWYQGLAFNDTNNVNLLGIGWLEVYGRTNLYNTKAQNLLTYPIVDGTDISSSQSQSIIGAYSFGIPTNAGPGDVYQVQLSRPSATTYSAIGYGSPVTINAQANTNLVGPGSVNAIKNITIGYLKYLVGDVYPANWYNAGDFGSSNLVNIDVIRVFDFAAYPIASPPSYSDLYDALDSSGNFGYTNGLGYYTNTMTFPETIVLPNAVIYYTTNYSTNGSVLSSSVSFDNYTALVYQTTYYIDVPYYVTNNYNVDILPPSLPSTVGSLGYNRIFIPPTVTTLFDGNATNDINQIAFGDGVLDICDVYVTFRRSLDSSLLWYERFWTNGQRVADTAVVNHAAHVAVKPAVASKVAPKVRPADSVPPQVLFAAGNVSARAGSVVQVPITATIQGDYPLCLLLLNLDIAPNGGAPVLSTAVQFNQTASVLGSPYTTDSVGNGNYAAVWLNAGNKGLTGTATIGNLLVTIPATAPSGSTYTVFFDHASGSPTGLASFPSQTTVGTITVQ